jgi:hypothetical protein
MKARALLQFVAGFGVCIALFFLLGAQQATESRSSVNALSDRDVYYPGSEDLAADEMRLRHVR